MSTIVALDEATFDAAIAAAVPVVVDFWAVWCAPCRAIAPELERLAAAYGERLRVAKVDVDAHPGLAARFEVRSIPTLLCFFPGDPTPRAIVGLVNAEGIVARFGLPPLA